MSGKKELKAKSFLGVIFVTAALLLAGCADALSEPTEGMGVSESPDVPTVVFDVPQADRWGIYSLDLSTQEVDLIFSSPERDTPASRISSKDSQSSVKARTRLIRYKATGHTKGFGLLEDVK